MALARDPQRVLDFYNYRRREVAKAEPNPGHLALAALEQHHEVTIITQNIDDLHERAGSSHIIHIHGEVFKARSMTNFGVVQEVRGDVNLGDLAEDGSQLRPHICFFHETPYDWDLAVEEALSADIFVVIGTSLQVYPAAGLVDITTARQIWLIDPNPPDVLKRGRIQVIAEPASSGVAEFAKRISNSS
jgi:NAD-dependent deacetylase